MTKENLKFYKQPVAISQFVEQKFNLSCSFRCDQIYSSSWFQFVRHPGRTQAAQQIGTKIKSMVAMIFVTISGSTQDT